MTREYAVELFNSEIKNFKRLDYSPKEAVQEYIDAMEMAIKALEQETGEDTISRREAINAMVKLEQDDIESYGCAIPEGFDSSPAIEALEGLQPVAPQPKIGHWIWTLEDWNKWECSECGFTKRTDVHVSIGYKFCPKCGARMKN